VCSSDLEDTSEAFDRPQQRQAGGLQIRSGAVDTTVRKGDFRPSNADAIGAKKIGAGQREIVDDLAFSKNLEFHSSILTLDTSANSIPAHTSEKHCWHYSRRAA
jgi:hypothetical protein